MRVRIYRRAVTVPREDALVHLVGLHMEAMRTIFNPNDKRMQSRLDQKHVLVRNLSAFLCKCGEMQGRVAGTAVLIQSLPGCKRQQWHRDYDIKRLRRMPAPRPCGVILALQDETFFDTYPGTRHELNAGDVLVFDADVVHAGSAYSAFNVRVHMYLDTPSYRLVDDVTYPYSKLKKQ